MQKLYKSTAFEDPVVQQIHVALDAVRDETSVEQGIAARSALRLGHSDDMSQTHEMKFRFEWCPPSGPVNLKDINQAKKCFRFLDATLLRNDTIKDDKRLKEVQASFKEQNASNFGFCSWTTILHLGVEIVKVPQMGIFTAAIYTFFKPIKAYSTNSDWEDRFRTSWQASVNLQDDLWRLKRKIEDIVNTEQLSDIAGARMLAQYCCSLLS